MTVLTVIVSIVACMGVQHSLIPRPNQLSSALTIIHRSGRAANNRKAWYYSGGREVDVWGGGGGVEFNHK